MAGEAAVGEDRPDVAVVGRNIVRRDGPASRGHGGQPASNRGAQNHRASIAPAAGMVRMSRSRRSQHAISKSRPRRIVKFQYQLLPATRQARVAAKSDRRHFRTLRSDGCDFAREFNYNRRCCRDGGTRATGLSMGDADDPTIPGGCSAIIGRVGAASCTSGRQRSTSRSRFEPIFAAHCVKCHGEAKAQGKMRLDTVAGIEEKLAAKPQLLVAGKPDESVFYQRLVLPADSPKRMPKGGDPLAKDEIELIARVDQARGGADDGDAAVGPPAAETKAAEKGRRRSRRCPKSPPHRKRPSTNWWRLAHGSRRSLPAATCSKCRSPGAVEPAGDAEVALVADVAEQVYTLNLADAKVSRRRVGAARRAARI